jgi:pimeloyl-ACP methyl ester carboxylesterase
MAAARVNGVELYYELAGTGPPLVLVHGSWVDHRSWDAVTPGLAESFQVLRYDRRGHSRSERPQGQGSIREDVADLAALIEHADLAPAYVAGNSWGASITLRLAGERPELLRGLIAHEPPLLALLSDDRASRKLLEEASVRIAAVVELLEAGDHEEGARRFVETVALGPGAWDQLPPGLREAFVFNAPTYLDECRDPEQLTIDLRLLASFPHPAQLSDGSESPPFFPRVVKLVAAALPRGRHLTFSGAGHVPQLSHPDAYVENVRAFAA